MSEVAQAYGGLEVTSEAVPRHLCRYFGLSRREHDDVVRFSTHTLGETAATEMAPELLGITDRDECRRLVLDFDRVERMSSAMLAKIVKVKRIMESKGGAVTLVNLCPRIRQAFRVTKLDQILDIVEDDLEAGASVSNGDPDKP
jgi:anti-sigma B factor antagonist